MAQTRDREQEERATKVAQWVEAQHLGTPIKEFVMLSTLRYMFKWSLLYCEGFGILFFIIVLVNISPRYFTQMSAALTDTGWFLVGVALGWLIYFLPAFRRYDKKHSTYFYICPNGMVVVLGGTIVSTYYWEQVQATSLSNIRGLRHTVYISPCGWSPRHLQKHVSTSDGKSASRDHQCLGKLSSESSGEENCFIVR